MINVPETFHKLAFGQVINPIVRLYISFSKEIEMGQFFVLNQSQLNGADILKGSQEDIPAQDWDFYKFNDYTDRLVDVDWSRSLQFPYQIQCGMLDFTVSNTDGYFTPLNTASSIGETNLPNRPIKLYAGYNDTTQIVPQFVGLTQELPSITESATTAQYHAIDFLHNICSQPLSKAIAMKSVTTDAVIASILESYGLAPSQYKLAKGRYTIPFVFFDINEDAGSALKQLVQSENGFMWLDEQGIIRFETSASVAADANVVAKLSSYDIMSITPSDISDIINHITINAEVREVQAWQEVYAKSESTESVSDNLWVVPANGEVEIRCGLADPCYDVQSPTLGKASSVSWFTAIDSHLNDITDGITASGTLSSNAFTITFSNSHSYPVEINELKLWGEPAKVYDVINYDAYDDESVEKYGNQLLEISDNQFFQTYQQADHYARSVIGERKDYNRMIVAEIKGDFSFQIMDMIELDTIETEYNGIYRIVGIEYSLNENGLVTKLQLNGAKIHDGEFTLNISVLNGEDKLQ